MTEKDNHRTIRLDGDVKNIASELASRRELSKVLSELLRKEYGMTFEEDLMNTKINELNRQKQEIEENLSALEKVQQEKADRKQKRLRIEELEKQFSLLNLNMKNEIDELSGLTLEDFNIPTEGFEDHQIMASLSRMKTEGRQKIIEKFQRRSDEIQFELSDLKRDIENN